MKTKSSKTRNPHAISAKSRKSGVIPPKTEKRQNGTNEQSEYLQQAEDNEMKIDINEGIWLSENNPSIMSWYIGPLTRERIAELRYKLAKARGLLISLIDWETDDKEMLPTTQEIKAIIKETEDP